jgi:hypothetical protein
METEARLKRSRRTDVKSGYSDKTIIVEYGTTTPTAEVMAADAIKYGGFVGEDGDRIMLLYAESQAQEPTIKTVSAPDASKRYQTDGETLKADIRAVFQIPSLLYGEATAGKALLRSSTMLPSMCKTWWSTPTSVASSARWCPCSAPFSGLTNPTCRCAPVTITRFRI